MTEEIVTYGVGKAWDGVNQCWRSLTEDEKQRGDKLNRKALEKVDKPQDRLDRFRHLFHITRNYPWASPQKHFDYIRGLV